jgi:hypothetical protein
MQRSGLNSSEVAAGSLKIVDGEKLGSMIEVDAGQHFVVVRGCSSPTFKIPKRNANSLVFSEILAPRRAKPYTIQ